MKTSPTIRPNATATRSTRPLAPILTPGSDTVLKWAAGTAWLLSVWALVATAGAAAPAETQTALRPTQSRISTNYGSDDQPRFRNDFRSEYRRNDYRTNDYRTNDYRTNDYRTNYGPRPATQPHCPDGRCPIPSDSNRPTDRTQPTEFGRPAGPSVPNYGDLFNGRRTQPLAPTQPTQPVNYDRPDYSDRRDPAPGHRSSPSARDKVEYRYGNPQFVRIGQRASLQDATALYMELSDLIDRRHVSPTGYEARTRAAIEGVSEALSSPSFLNAAGSQSDAAAISRTRQTLAALAQRPARSSHEAIGLMQQTAGIVRQNLGVPTGLTGMEFVHATLDSLDRYSSLVPTATAAIEGELPTHANAGHSDKSVWTDVLTMTAAHQTAAGLDETIVGIGVEMKSHDRGALVNGTVSGGPASAAGLSRGDVITHIDGRPIAGQTISQIADRVGGRAGTQLRLTIDRGGRSLDRLLTRRSLYVSSVADTKMLTDGGKQVGYARLKQFSAGSARDLERALWTLHREGMEGFVLDLRGNPGGLLTSAIEISDLFLPSGSIVQTRGRTAEDQMHERANFSKTWSVPLVVLIDEGSASASEILAAAIQENDRGVIVGSRSYGKGTVQTHFPLRSLQANAKLTTAKFYSPRGREMAGSGVLPNITTDTDDDRQTIAAALRTLSDGTPHDLASQIRNGLRR